MSTETLGSQMTIKNGFSEIMYDPTPFNHYIEFVNQWDKHQIDQVKQLKALIRFKDNQTEIIDVPLLESIPLEKSISKIDVRYLGEKAKDATEIVLAENAPFSNLDENQNVKKIIKALRSEMKNTTVKISDYLVLSPYSYYSHKVNDKQFNLFPS